MRFDEAGRWRTRSRYKERANEGQKEESICVSPVIDNAWRELPTRSPAFLTESQVDRLTFGAQLCDVTRKRGLDFPPSRSLSLPDDLWAACA